MQKLIYDIVERNGRSERTDERTRERVKAIRMRICISMRIIESINQNNSYNIIFERDKSEYNVALFSLFGHNMHTHTHNG